MVHSQTTALELLASIDENVPKSGFLCSLFNISGAVIENIAFKQRASYLLDLCAFKNVRKNVSGANDIGKCKYMDC